MNKIKVITDGCSDIPREWRDEYDIDYAPLSLIWNDEERPASCDWEQYSAKEYYDAIRAGARIKSNQVSRQVFEDLFNKYLDEGCDIIYIGCPSALSGSVNLGAMVAKEITEKRDGAKIRVIDPSAASGCEAMMAVQAVKWARSGMDVDEVTEKVKELSTHAFQVGSVDTLEYLKRAGRVKAAAAFFGNLFGIKPIIVNDEKGNNIAVKKVKGRQNAIDTCIAMLKDVMCYDGQTYPVSEQTVFIGHADCRDTADYIAEKVKELIAPKDVVINYIGAPIGASVGPTMFGIYAFGKTAAERAL